MVKKVFVLAVCCCMAVDCAVGQSQFSLLYSDEDVITRHAVQNFRFNDPPERQSYPQEPDSLFSDTLASQPNGQPRPEPTNQINYTRMAIVGGGLVAVITGVHIYQQNGWWKDNRAPFHFREDLKYGLWVDKVGHVYGAVLAGFLATKAFEWTNVSE